VANVPSRLGYHSYGNAEVANMYVLPQWSQFQTAMKTVVPYSGTARVSWTEPASPNAPITR
jgi:hypothetical protein